MLLGLLFAVLSIAAFGVDAKEVPKNVNGRPLKVCSKDPMTGYLRDGTCRTLPNDYGTHVVCAVMTEEFLVFTKSQGNDLSSPAPQYDFPGLHPGDRWCLCALRWREAWNVNKAPTVDPEATYIRALEPAFEPINKLDLMNSCSRSNWDEQLSKFKPGMCLKDELM